MLTEQEVARSWNQLFQTKDVSDVTFERAEILLDELRAESPLRHRLSNEMIELKRIHAKVLNATG